MEKKDNARIEIIKNGPYTVKGLKEFENSKGEKFPVKRVMVLCRCGQSGKKPFCDGTHIKTGFKDDKDPRRDPDKVVAYKGKHITIYDNRGVCSHRGHCTEELPSVWRSGQKPFIDPDGAPVDEIIAICEKCPSGALSYSLPGQERKQDVEGRTEKIAIAPRHFDADGPYDISGGIDLTDPAGCQPECKEHYNLCRCGSSKNKPFCSGEHWYINFIDDNN